MARAVIHRHYQDYPDEAGLSPVVWILLLILAILVLAGLFFLYRAGTFTQPQAPTINIETPGGGGGGQGSQGGTPGGVPSTPSTTTT